MEHLVKYILPINDTNMEILSMELCGQCYETFGYDCEDEPEEIEEERGCVLVTCGHYLHKSCLDEYRGKCRYFCGCGEKKAC
jgi:hypothetical protein